MASVPHAHPRRVAVVGAGMTGLSAAWFLQEHGVEVTVFERDHVAAGSSWGNAGWLTPSIAVPLPEPSVLTYGIRAVLSPSSPVYVPLTANPRLLRFLMRFMRNCTPRRWQKAMRDLIPLNSMALDTFAELDDSGIAAVTKAAEPFTAAFRSVEESRALLDEFEHIRACGQEVNFEVVDGDEARREEPVLSDEVATAIRIQDERFIDPGAYVAGLAEGVRSRGGVIHEGCDIARVMSRTGFVEVGGEFFDSVVLANGAWLDHDARHFGVRRVIQAGRGYSFSVEVDQLPQGPVYFPTQRVACTPMGDRLRIAGMMEFRDVSAPMDPRRITALVDQAGVLLKGARLHERHDEWVGARPCTADGLPLVGATDDPRVFVSGGHGMWGITLGPVTGKLLARQIVTGERVDALEPLDPLR